MEEKIYLPGYKLYNINNIIVNKHIDNVSYIFYGNSKNFQKEFKEWVQKYYEYKELQK